MSAVTPFNPINISLFQPNQIGGLALWLDAADPATVITSGANVTQWRDKSSNAHICISNANYTGTFLPTYNSNATYKNVNFADNQALVTSSNWNYVTSWSCFVALNTVSLAGRWLISPHNLVNPVLMAMNQGTSKIFNSAFNSVPADVVGNHIEYTSAENTNALSNLLWYRDGTLQASNVKNQGVPSGTSKMGIGANATLNNAMGGTYQLYEVLIFNSYLSGSQRQQIESYLAYKWNLQSNLPTTHPYYNSPYNAYPPFTNINQTIKFAYPVLPTNIAGLSLWLDAADSSTMSFSGAIVTQWRDKSGNGWNANAVGTDMTYVTSGRNGLNTIQGPQAAATNALGFTTPSFAISTTNSTSIFVVYNQLVNSASDASFILMPSSTNLQVFTRTNYYYTRVNGITGGGGYVPSTPYTSILEFVYTPNTGTLYANGTQYNTITTTAGGTAALNSSFILNLFLGAMQGNICELLIFGTALSTTQRQQMEGYLAYKWGLQGSLPVNHPYYNNPITQSIVRSIPNPITMYQYSPRSLSGLALWLDAADSNTVLRTGVNVSAWNDKSGNGFNMSNNASYQSPTYNTSGFNGKPTISFVRNSSNSFSILENTTFSFTQNSFSLFVISQKTGSDAVVYQRFFSAAATIGGQDYNTGNNFNVNTGLTNTSIDYEKNGKVIGTFTITNPFLGEVIVNGTGSAIGRYNSVTNYIYANGSQVNASTTPSAGANFNTVHVRLGAATYTLSTNDNNILSFNGNISEVLFFNRALTTIESQQVEGYLAWKWGLQANLPANHPYKLYPP